MDENDNCLRAQVMRREVLFLDLERSSNPVRLVFSRKMTQQRRPSDSPDAVKSFRVFNCFSYFENRKSYTARMFRRSSIIVCESMGRAAYVFTTYCFYADWRRFHGGNDSLGVVKKRFPATLGQIEQRWGLPVGHQRGAPLHRRGHRFRWSSASQPSRSRKCKSIFMSNERLT